MNPLEELDRLVMRQMLMDFQKEDMRTAPFYNAVGSFLERHAYTLATFRTQGGGFEFCEYTKEEVDAMTTHELLAVLDGYSYHYMMEDLPVKGSPTFYNAIGKLLHRHEISLARKSDNTSMTEEHKAGLEAFRSKFPDGLSNDDYTTH